MKYNYTYLCERIKKYYKNKEEFINDLGMKKDSFLAKINNEIDFEQEEIAKICKLLKIPDNLICYYFFNK